MAITRSQRQTFEAAGETTVGRLLDAGGYPRPEDTTGAMEWLAECEAERTRQAAEERAHDASIASKAKMTLSTVNIAMIVISSLTLIATILAWLFPRR